MKSVDQIKIKQVIKIIYNDALSKNSNDYFLTLQYHHSIFKEYMGVEVFSSVIGFLPNIKHREQPFIISVSNNISTGVYDITVINPRIRA